ncbi:MAG: long-chain N-acyl amino acid synthase [Rubrivivax sp.]
MLHTAQHAPDRTFTIRTTTSGPERERVGELLHQRYSWRGYRTVTLPTDQTGFRTTLSAHEGDATIGTLTLELDGPSGLAADNAFSDVTAGLRAEGCRMAEFTRLAIDPDGGSPRVLAALFHVGYIVAFRMRLYDTLLLEVNPRHVRFYERMLGCRMIGESRIHPTVQAPAVLLSARFDYIRDQIGAYGGKPEQAMQARSLYPFAFSRHDEDGIFERLLLAQLPELDLVN